MFFRFAAALLLVVVISLVGTALEKRNLELRRAVSRQHYRLELLIEQHAANRVLAQRLGAPTRLVDQVDLTPAPAASPAKPGKPASKPARQKRHKSPASPTA